MGITISREDNFVGVEAVDPYSSSIEQDAHGQKVFEETPSDEGLHNAANFLHGIIEALWPYSQLVHLFEHKLALRDVKA